MKKIVITIIGMAMLFGMTSCGCRGQKAEVSDVQDTVEVAVDSTVAVSDTVVVVE